MGMQAKGKMEDVHMPWEENGNQRWRTLVQSINLTHVQRTSIIELRRHLRAKCANPQSLQAQQNMLKIGMAGQETVSVNPTLLRLKNILCTNPSWECDGHMNRLRDALDKSH